MTPSRRVCSKCSGYHECECTLVRIAVALERLADAQQQPAYVVSTAPYHGVDGGSGMRPLPTVQRFDSLRHSPAPLDPDKCWFVTAANMQCQLEHGHTTAHDIGLGV